MVLAFFNSKGLVNTNHVARGNPVNANYIVDALGKFLKVFKQKRPLIVAGDWWFSWEKCQLSW